MSVFGPDQRHLPPTFRYKATRTRDQDLADTLAALRRKVLACEDGTEDERASMIADIETMQSDVGARLAARTGRWR